METLNQNTIYYAVPLQQEVSPQAVQRQDGNRCYIWEGQELNQDDYFAKIRRDFQSFAKESVWITNNPSMMLWKKEKADVNRLVYKLNTLDDFIWKEKWQTHFEDTLDTLIVYRNMRIIDQFAQSFFVRGVSPKHSMKVVIDSNTCPAGNALYQSSDDTVHIGQPNWETTLWKHSLDTLAHEFGHAFASKSKLPYQNESGALDESIADIMGTMCHHYNAKTPFHTADWKHSRGAYKADPNHAIRSFTAEKGRPQDNTIKHMRDYNTLQPVNHDYGWVHAKSGISSHAFYLVCRELGGFSYEIPGHIWCNTLSDAAESDDFATFARRTLITATHVYDDRIAGIVKQAWLKVGIEEKELNKPLPKPWWVKTLNRPTPVTKPHEVSPVAFNTSNTLLDILSKLEALNCTDQNLDQVIEL